MAEYDREFVPSERINTTNNPSSRIMLQDQVQEQEKLIEILKNQINTLEEVLSPILLQEPEEASSGNKDSDVAPSMLSPLQESIMAQYNRLNMLVSRVENIRRRVQL